MWYVILGSNEYQVTREEGLFERLETMPETVDGVSGGFLSMKAAREWAKGTRGSKRKRRKRRR